MASSGRHWSVSSGAALAAAAIHALLLAPLVVGGSNARPPLPDQPGAGASALHSSTELVEAMTLVDLLHTKSSEEPPLEELASLGMELPSSMLVVASPELAPMPMLEEDMTEDSTVEAVGDTQGHAAMFGRYLGQITARIERAWRRPRSAMEAARFSCQTKIEQDEQGKVLSVELRHCNGDTQWQRSLVSAIEHASPLPAPPTPSVFARSLVLSFSSEPWQEGVSNAHLFKPADRVAVTGSTVTASEIVTNPNKSLADVAGHRGHIELRIEGSKVQWTLGATKSDSATRAIDSSHVRDAEGG